MEVVEEAGAEDEEEGESVTLRVLIPTDDPDGREMAPHFGRASYFAVIELDDSNSRVSQEVHANTGTHQGGKGHAHDNVLSFNPQVVIVSGMGPRGIRRFQDSGIAVLKADNSSVDRVLESYSAGRLSELTEGCADAHHK